MKKIYKWLGLSSTIERTDMVEVGTLVYGTMFVFEDHHLRLIERKNIKTGLSAVESLYPNKFEPVWYMIRSESKVKVLHTIDPTPQLKAFRKIVNANLSQNDK